MPIRPMASDAWEGWHVYDPSGAQGASMVVVRLCVRRGCRGERVLLWRTHAKRTREDASGGASAL